MAATYSVDGQSFGSIGEVEDYLSGQGYDSYTIDDRRQGGIGTQSGVGMGEGAGLLGAAGGGGRGFTSFGDMFDGGGPGRSGPTFVGGPYSAGLNAVGVRPAGYTERMAAAPGPQGQRGFNGYGYTDPKTGQWVSAGRDMIDGGGPGRSGDTFQGGIFSGLLNTLGVRPAGYRQRLEDNLAPQTSLRPQARPAGLLGGTAGTQSAVDRALDAASGGNTSAAQSFSGMPYQIGITPPAVAPAQAPAGANIGTAEILALMAASNPMTYQPVPGVSSSHLFPVDYQPPRALWSDPEWAADNRPRVYGADAGYPSDIRPYMGMAPDREFLPIYDASRMSRPQPTVVDDFRQRLGLAPLGR